MHFFKLTLTALCLAVCLSFATAHAADVPKIGLVDLQLVLTSSDAGKDAQAKIAAKGKELEADLKAKSTAIEQEKAAYEKESSVLSTEAKTEKERALKIKVLDYQDLETKYKSEFTSYNQELVNQFKVDVLKVAEEIGKKDGYTLILEKRESGVVFATSAIDITEAVIKQYNESNAKTSK